MKLAARTDGEKDQGFVFAHDLRANAPRLSQGKPVPTFPDHASTRPPKNGINARLSVCGLFEVKNISARSSRALPAAGPSKSAARRAIAGAGSIHSTGQGASFTKRSSSSG